MIYDFEAKAVLNLAINGFDIYLIKRLGDGTVRWLEFSSATEHVEPEVSLSLGKVQPAFRLEMAVAEKLVAALANQGVKPDPDAKLQGKLEATEYHLEDMRRLLHLKGKME